MGIKQWSQSSKPDWSKTEGGLQGSQGQTYLHGRQDGRPPSNLQPALQTYTLASLLQGTLSRI